VKWPGAAFLVLGLTAVSLLLLPLLGGTARAAESSPAWALQMSPQPTTFDSAECRLTSCDHYTITATNVGAAATHGTVKVTVAIPAGLQIRPERTGGRESPQGLPVPCSVLGRTIECTFEEPLEPDERLRIQAMVVVEPGTAAGPLDPARAIVEGGGGGAIGTSAPTSVEMPSPFKITTFGLAALGADGKPDTQAGSHPYAVRSSAEFPARRGVSQEAIEFYPYGSEPQGNLRSALVYLPAGMVGDPGAASTCDVALIESGNTQLCPLASRVGDVTINVPEMGFVSTDDYRGEPNAISPLFEITPEKGYPAEFAFQVKAGIVTVYASVVHGGRQGGGYVLRVGSPNVPAVLGISPMAFELNFYGEPSVRDGGQTPRGAFLRDPTSCSGEPLLARMEARSWQNPAGWVDAETTVFPRVVGCESLQFRPTFSVAPELTDVDTPSGYRVELKVPQAANVSGILATSDLKDARVTLPEGLVISPSAANGLSACAAEGPNGINIGSSDIGPAGEDRSDPEATELGAGHPGGNRSSYDDGIYHTAAGHCPASSQIGSLEIKTPLLEEARTGYVYVTEPGCGGSKPPCTDVDATDGDLYGIYLEAAGSGVIVKLHGEVSADPRTGRLTATFTENPQLPFESFRLRFYGGPTAVLANPQICGSYRTTTDFTPWSTPQTPDATPPSAFAISSGAHGGTCAGSEGQMPNAPSFEAGTTNPLGGSYSPFVLKVSREDGTQRLHSLNVTLPEGLLARLSGTPYCPDSAIAAASAKSGMAEKANPSCPTSSAVGTVTVGAGPGSTPYYVTGQAYLSGPYKGAPLSLAIITSAVAGPFDLGTVVVRTALYVDPTTARVTARSDPFPTILEGAPLDIRSIALKLDKFEFTLNPTNCEEGSISGEATSTTGNASILKNRFQVAGCKSLDFKPNLKVQLKGATKRVGHPALKAVLTAKPGEANIARAQVNLPHGEFLDQGNLNKTCTRPVLLAGNCPKSTVYGKAKAWTPLLDKPLQGPVYLVGGYGYK
jgi:hypothetical protein